MIPVPAPISSTTEAGVTTRASAAAWASRRLRSPIMLPKSLRLNIVRACRESPPASPRRRRLPCRDPPARAPVGSATWLAEPTEDLELAGALAGVEEIVRVGVGEEVRHRLRAAELRDLASARRARAARPARRARRAAWPARRTGTRAASDRDSACPTCPRFEAAPRDRRTGRARIRTTTTRAAAPAAPRRPSPRSTRASTSSVSTGRPMRARIAALVDLPTPPAPMMPNARPSKLAALACRQVTPRSRSTNPSIGPCR